MEREDNMTRPSYKMIMMMIAVAFFLVAALPTPRGAMNSALDL
jgi:hypothetical protein